MKPAFVITLFITGTFLVVFPGLTSPWYRTSEVQSLVCWLVGAVMISSGLKGSFSR
jgi:threonine/homoserine/homoserine lactone efflux protein